MITCIIFASNLTFAPLVFPATRFARPFTASVVWSPEHSQTQTLAFFPSPHLLLRNAHQIFHTHSCFLLFFLPYLTRSSLPVAAVVLLSSQVFAANSNNLDRPTPAMALTGTARDPTSVAVSTASAAASRDAVATSGSIGSGGVGGAGRPVFHEHVLQAMGSLRQRNVAAFSTAVGNARSLALARLGSGGGASQEGGKGLYPCLVQLQCVAEMEEAFEVLSSASAGAAPAEGGEHGVEDAVTLVFLSLCFIFVLFVALIFAPIFAAFDHPSSRCSVSFRSICLFFVVFPLALCSLLYPTKRRTPHLPPALSPRPCLECGVYLSSDLPLAVIIRISSFPPFRCLLRWCTKGGDSDGTVACKIRACAGALRVARARSRAKVCRDVLRCVPRSPPRVQWKRPPAFPQGRGRSCSSEAECSLWGDSRVFTN